MTEETRSKGLYSLEQWMEEKNSRSLKTVNELSGGVHVVPLNDFRGFVESLGFAGYMVGPVAITEEGQPVEARTKTFDSLEELQKADFSNTFLYDIQEVRFRKYDLPEGKNPWDYDIVELGKFDWKEQYGYKVRLASPVIEE